MKRSTSEGFHIVLFGHYSSLHVKADRDREKENWPLDIVGGHYRFERWLTGTKGFSVFQKKSIGDIEEDRLHYYVSVH